MPQRRRTGLSSWCGPRDGVRDHVRADDLEPRERTAVESGIAGIDTREAAAAEDLDAFEVGRVADDHAPGAERGEHDVELSLRRQVWRLARGADGLRIRVGHHEPAVP